MRPARNAFLLASAWLAAAGALSQPRGERFREANDLARAGDYPRAESGYGALAASGAESASLYWNWAQAASAHGAHGEALWALLRARELDPGDRAVGREVERVRQQLNLDPAEIAPEPLAAVARVARRYRLDLVAGGLLLLSVAAHAVARLRGRRGALAAGLLLALGLGLALVPFAGERARATAAVVRRGAPLFESASPAAEATGTLREGEVVPVLEASGEWMRVEDSAGARGWVRADDVRWLDRAPRPPD